MTRTPAPRRRLPQKFFRRDAAVVAPDLLGRWLRRDDVILRITEVEAYLWPNDTACHARSGPTPRNQVMFGQAGHTYVYLCYGLHQMLNIVTNEIGEGSAVLIRSAEPVAGLDTICSRRGGREGPALLTGPGKVGAALAVDTSWSGHKLFRPGGLEVLEGDGVDEVLVGPRVGIDYADPDDVVAPLRFAAGGTRWVSHRKGLSLP